MPPGLSKVLRPAIGLPIDPADDNNKDIKNSYFDAVGNIRTPRRVSHRSPLRERGQLCSLNKDLLEDIGFSPQFSPNLEDILSRLYSNRQRDGSLAPGCSLNLQYEATLMRFQFDPGRCIAIGIDANQSSNVCALVAHVPGGHILKAGLGAGAIESATHIKRYRAKAAFERSLAVISQDDRAKATHLHRAMVADRLQRGAFRRIAFLVRATAQRMVTTARIITNRPSMNAFILFGMDFDGNTHARPWVTGGSVQTPVRMIVEELRRFFLVIGLNEYMTSQSCSRCNGRLELFKPRPGRCTGRLKKCVSCSDALGHDLVFHRDFNAALQLVFVALSYSQLGYRPRHLVPNPEHEYAVQALQDAGEKGCEITTDMVRAAFPYLSDWLADHIAHQQAPVEAARSILNINRLA